MEPPDPSFADEFNVPQEDVVLVFDVRRVAVSLPVSGTRFSILDWVRVTGLSCTKGVWYIYDWDTRSSILP